MQNEFLTRPGQRYGNFELIKIVPIPELQATLREILHIPTGAEVMHIENDDPENLFCLSFKTLPSSSNGAPHILEHTVLCGSRKYPIKDPFFSMNRRSLNTFMNALTGTDFTCYPAASQVEKDFYNLLEVYLDAVFHPLLKEASFLQEGHRFEFTRPDDPSSPIKLMGIVYNEMKGSLSSVDTRVWHKMMEHLFPGLPYAYNSGGDPSEIPSLSYSQLIEFYETYYHPSRCLFFFYGDLPLKKHLDYLEEHTLKAVQKLPPIPAISKQKRFNTPIKKEYSYPTEEKNDLEKKSILCFGWLTSPLIDQEEVLALSILDSVLMDTDASLLKKSILQSGLCVKADSVIDTEMSEVPYLIVCKGCRKEDAEALEKAIFDRLFEIVESKIPYHLIEAAIDLLEFSRTEILKDQAPFGLTLFMRCALAKQHGCPPENALTMHSLFQNILKKARDPAFLTQVLRKYFIDNPHFVRLTFVPDPSLSAKEAGEEKAYLKKTQSELSEKQKARILDQAKVLSSYQEEVEHQNLDCLPKVTLKDVPQGARDLLLEEEQLGHLKVFRHECFTNHILYVDLIFDFPQLEQEDLFYAQLLIMFFAEVGAGKRNYEENLELIHAHTGGIRASGNLYVPVSDPHLTTPSLHIRGKALKRKIPQFFELLGEMVSGVRFDEEKRISDLINQVATGLQSNLTRNAMKYASLLAISGFSEAGHISELWSGITFYQKIRDIASDLDKNLPIVMEKLMMLKDRLLCINTPHLVLSTDQEIYNELKKGDFFGLTRLPIKKLPHWVSKPIEKKIPSQARVISSPVAFTVEAFNTINYLHPDAPALHASTLLFDNEVLHQAIREKGGAYGSGATFNSLWGNFSFYSYRDPHIAKTLQAFNEAAETIAEGHFDENDLDEAKLGIIQQLDQPISPGSKALMAYSWWRDGKTKAMRQNHRDKLLALTVDEMQTAVQKQILTKKESSTVVTFAGKEQIEKENSSLQKPLKIIPI
ncbi:MAG TPA: insulinase family protein [Rhabdochlamydiaceae bacterium]|nr:insulinase family protein [Rhabdochlamydiaceae bacterium]